MFKVGDKVRCIDCRAIPRLKNGDEYVVSASEGNYINIDGGTDCTILSSRFSLIVNRGVVAPFWLVKGDGPTSFHHDSIESATNDAKRLALEHPGKHFTVLSPLAAYVKCDVQVIALDGYTSVREYEELNPTDVPF